MSVAPDMVDLFGAIAATGVYALVVGTLVGLAPVEGFTKAIALITATAWGGLVIALAAPGSFAPAVASGTLIAVLIAGWFLVTAVRSAFLAPPLQTLIGLNVARAVVGTLFLILAAQGRLSEPFASFAGGGDVVAGVLAIPLALMALSGLARSTMLIAFWNVFGALDIVVAVSLGLLSAPGTAFRIFMDEPGTLLLTQLPWGMIPAMPLPIYLVIHLAIAVKLRAQRRS